MRGILGRIWSSPYDVYRALYFRPLAVALGFLFILPSLPQFGPADSSSSHIFSAFAQNTGCPTSQNQIIQTACNTPVVAQFEQAAVQSYLALHQLPSTDAPLIYQYGTSELRNEIRAQMLQLILSYAAQGPATLDNVQGGGYYWLQGLVQTEEQKYWAAASNEYLLWKQSPCNYQIDPDVASAQGLQYDSAQWCYPSLASLFSYPEVPTYNYFLAVAWKKTYGSVLGTGTSGLTELLTVQQEVEQDGALYTLPGAFFGGSALAGTVALNVQSIRPFAFDEAYQISPQNSQLAESLTRAAGEKFVVRNATVADQSAQNVDAAGESAETVDPLEGGVGQAADAVDPVLEGAEAASAAGSEAGDAIGLAAGASAATVVAVAVFAIETAVEAGISATNNQQNLDQIATLPTLAAQAANNPVSLQTFLGTSDGYLKAATMFMAATLPEFPNASYDAGLLPGAGDFYIPQSNFTTSVLNYLDSKGKVAILSLRGGWFVDSETDGNHLIGQIGFTDWDGAQRFASRVGPFQFLVWRPQPLANDNYCPGSASDNDLSPNLIPSQCFAYVTNALPMLDSRNNKMSVEIVTLPTLTSATSVYFTPGVQNSFQLTLSAPVNDVPCSLSRSGTLPLGLQYNPTTYTFSGTTTGSYAGVYNQTLTVACGGLEGLTTTFSFALKVASTTNLAFTSPTDIYGTLGVLENFLVTTTGLPTPKLTNNLYLPIGWSFNDNGNGTGTISGRATSTLLLLPPNGCPIQGPCNNVTASNGLQTATWTPVIHLAPNPNPLQVTAPGNGSTIIFPAGTFTTMSVQTTGGTDGPITFSFIPPAQAPPFPSWLNLNDNGDGTATVSGTPPLSASGQTISIRAFITWAAGEVEDDFTISVTIPQPAVSVASGSSLAFLAGTSSTVNLTSNIQEDTGTFQPTGSLPPGLSFNWVPINPLCTSDCPVTATVTGTPPIGSGGDYKVPFQVTNSLGTFTQTLDFVIYDKPALINESRIVFYAGIPATKVLSASGFPLAPIGPFSDGVGYSAGATFSDPSRTFPSYLNLVSGLDGAPNGTARLTSTATSANIGIYPISITIQETAAPSPEVTNPATQLGSVANLLVFILPPGDVNLDFKVNCADLDAIKAAFNQIRGNPGYSSILDVNNDGIINIKDLTWVASKLPPGTKCN